MKKPTQSQTFADQLPAFEALAALEASHPDLPQPYVTVHSVGCRFDVQLQSPAEFEVWREALGMPASHVDLKQHSLSVWLEADGEFAGVPVSLSGFGVESAAAVKAAA